MKDEIKKCIKECLHNDTTIKFFGGRSSGRTYELITAMSECLYELNKTNKELISNQKDYNRGLDDWEPFVAWLGYWRLV